MEEAHAQDSKSDKEEEEEQVNCQMMVEEVDSEEENEDIQMKLNDWSLENKALLLDRGSATNIFGARGMKFLTNLKSEERSADQVQWRSQGNSSESKIWIAYVWYDDGAFANILSLRQVAEKYCHFQDGWAWRNIHGDYKDWRAVLSPSAKCLALSRYGQSSMAE